LFDWLAGTRFVLPCLADGTAPGTLLKPAISDAAGAEELQY
jgi:hypothetical protein